MPVTVCVVVVVGIVATLAFAIKALEVWREVQLSRMDPRTNPTVVADAAQQVRKADGRKGIGGG